MGESIPRRVRQRPVHDVSAIVLPRCGERVECAVRNYLHVEHAPVFYVENTLVNGLFGLLCWDAVFTDVPGAFFHPFQTGPSDLFDRGFATRRRPMVEDARQALNDDSWRDPIRECYRAKQGTISPFLHWGVLTPALLELALTCIALGNFLV